MRSLSTLIDIPKTFISRLCKNGDIKRRLNSLKPLLTLSKQLKRLEYSLFLKDN